jgi:hypothetical protein
VSSVFRWRDMSKSGLAAWANQTTEERVLDLLSDIMFAAEEIEEMAEAEAFEPLPSGFQTSLHNIYNIAATTMGAVVTRRSGH